MPHYVVSYDLHNVRAYKPVWDTLESWGAAKLLESLWLVTLNSSAGEIREALKQVIDGDDSVAVIELKTGSEWSAWKAKKPGTDWLTSNIKRY